MVLSFICIFVSKLYLKRYTFKYVVKHFPTVRALLLSDQKCIYLKTCKEKENQTCMMHTYTIYPTIRTKKNSIDTNSGQRLSTGQHVDCGLLLK